MKENEIVILAMRMIVEFRDMYKHCLSMKGSCSKCIYFKREEDDGDYIPICTRKSTIEVLFQAADIFKEFLEQD